MKGKQDLRGVLAFAVAQETADVIRASPPGKHAVLGQFESRIAHEIETGAVVVNRCPACGRVVQTPAAKQCLWCGHGWHGT